MSNVNSLTCGQNKTGQIGRFFIFIVNFKILFCNVLSAVVLGSALRLFPRLQTAAFAEYGLENVPELLFQDLHNEALDGRVALRNYLIGRYGHLVIRIPVPFAEVHGIGAGALGSEMVFDPFSEIGCRASDIKNRG